MNEYQGYIPRHKGSRCVGLTILPFSCADILESLLVAAYCNPRGLSKFVQGLLYLYFRNKTVMCLTHMRKEIGHMNSIECLNFYKWATKNTQLCKNLKDILISHPELSLQMNHQE
jgi:hypothetical protein